MHKGIFPLSDDSYCICVFVTTSLLCAFQFCFEFYAFSLILLPVEREMVFTHTHTHTHTYTHTGISIYTFAILLASLSSFDVLFSLCILPIGTHKIAVYLYTLVCKVIKCKQLNF